MLAYILKKIKLRPNASKSFKICDLNPMCCNKMNPKADYVFYLTEV